MALSPSSHWLYNSITLLIAASAPVLPICPPITDPTAARATPATPAVTIPTPAQITIIAAPPYTPPGSTHVDEFLASHTTSVTSGDRSDCRACYAANAYCSNTYCSTTPTIALLPHAPPAMPPPVLVRGHGPDKVPDGGRVYGWLTGDAVR